MNVNSISNFNPYNSAYRNSAALSSGSRKYSLENTPAIKQNVSDTVSFTGLPTFHKVNPIIRKTVSELPVSKTLQRQTTAMLSNLENFVKKGKVWITKNMPADATDDEKRALKAALSLVDLNKIQNAKTEDLLEELNQAVACMDKAAPEGLGEIKPVLGEITSFIKEASNLSDIEALNKFDNILAALDKFCETGEGTDMAFLRISSKLLKAVSDIAKKQALSPTPDVLPVKEKANIFKLCTNFLKDTKNVIEQSPERDEIAQAFKEISSTKLPK